MGAPGVAIDAEGNWELPVAVKDHLENKPDDTASIEALKVVIAAVEKLSENDRHRVLRTAVQFFNVYIS